MARQSLASAAGDTGQPDRFEALKLERGDTHRLWIPDEDYAAMEMVHNLRAPVFGEDGKPLTTEKTVRGGVKNVFDLENGWIGSPICLGDPAAYAAGQELDTANCPVCAGVESMIKAGIGDARDLLAQQRWAVPVIRYVPVSKTDPSRGLRRPYSAEILVWRLSQWSLRQVNGIRGQMAELLEVDQKVIKLQHCDILVKNENGFQKIDKIWPARCAWRHDSDAGREVKAVIAALWGVVENRPTDAQLRAACGREPNRDFLAVDIEDAEERWHRAWNYGKTPAPDPTGGGPLAGGTPASLDDGLTDLLADHPGGVAEFAPRNGSPAAAAVTEDPFADLAASPAAASPASSMADPFGDAAPAAAPAAASVLADPFGDAAPAAPAAAAVGEVASFDDIIGN